MRKTRYDRPLPMRYAVVWPREQVYERLPANMILRNRQFASGSSTIATGLPVLWLDSTPSTA